jgi:hypothetical protein
MIYHIWILSFVIFEILSSALVDRVFCTWRLDGMVEVLGDLGELRVDKVG